MWGFSSFCSNGVGAGKQESSLGTWTSIACTNLIARMWLGILPNFRLRGMCWCDQERGDVWKALVQLWAGGIWYLLLAISGIEMMLSFSKWINWWAQQRRYENAENWAQNKGHFCQRCINHSLLLTSSGGWRWVNWRCWTTSKFSC